MKTTLILFGALLLSSIFGHDSSAASFRFDDINYNNGESYGAEYILIDGPIVKGDAEKFNQFLYKNPSRVKSSFALMLNSPGGSVTEAISIGRMVRKIAFTTATADNGGRCASSCFFIWVAGVYRRSVPDEIGVHRAFADAATLDRFTFEEMAKGYAETQRTIKTYLDEMEVPRNFQDSIFQVSSKQLKWLNEADLISIGRFPAFMEEYLIAKCELDVSVVRKLMRPITEEDRKAAIAAMAPVYKCLNELKNQQVDKHLRPVSSRN